MALSKLQANSAIILFVASFVNGNDVKEKEQLLIKFVDAFGDGIADWQTKCRDKLCEYTSDSKIIEQYDRLAFGKREIE